MQASAIERAAGLLGNARFPVIGGLQTDIAGARAALALAERLGGVIDHEAGDALTRGSEIMRKRGGCPASFGETRNRADLVIIVGAGPLERDANLIAGLFPEAQGLPRPGENPRELVLIGAAKRDAPHDLPVTAIGLGASDIETVLATLGANVTGRTSGEGGGGLNAELAALAARLHQAAFPVFVYSTSDLGEPALNAILDMVHHLAVTARAATLALPVSGNGDGVNLCAIWTCGLPVRTSFAGSIPKHDPWLYAADRLIESGEGDALLWIDALEGKGAPRPAGVPSVVLTSARDDKATKHDVVIEVACAGRDHDAALYLGAIAGIGMVQARHKRDGAPTAADVLDAITVLLPSRGSRQC